MMTEQAWKPLVNSLDPCWLNGNRLYTILVLDETKWIRIVLNFIQLEHSMFRQSCGFFIVFFRRDIPYRSFGATFYVLPLFFGLSTFSGTKNLHLYLKKILCTFWVAVINLQRKRFLDVYEHHWKQLDSSC